MRADLLADVASVPQGRHAGLERLFEGHRLAGGQETVLREHELAVVNHGQAVDVPHPHTGEGGIGPLLEEFHL